MLAWHFVCSDRMTRFEPRVPIVAGETLRHPGKLVLCGSGMHASVRAIDALQYAPGPIICRVELSGLMLDGGDKWVAQERKVLWMADATEALHEMACCSAQAALLIAGVDDQRCWNAIEAKRAWRRGEITDQELAAASAAASAAAWDAARAATRAAAWDAASAAASAEQNTLLELLFNELEPSCSNAK